MHELAVTQSILEIATRHATQAKARRVTDIYLVIGRLSSIIDDSVQFYWDLISKDTICKGSTLHFERKPAEIICLECSTEFQVELEINPCPNCGSLKLKVKSGDQFWLESIEIEK